MTRQTSDPQELYQQTPILVETLAEHTHSTPEQVLEMLTLDTYGPTNSDEESLLGFINEYIAIQ